MFKLLQTIKLTLKNIMSKGTVNEVYYINGSETLPPPLTKEQETTVFKLLETNPHQARQELITHNLRLVV